MTCKHFIIAIIGALTLGVSVCEALTLTVPNITAAPSDTAVELTVTIADAQAIAGGDLTLTYNAQAFIATNVKKSDLLTTSGITLFHNLNTPGQIKLSMAGVTGINQANGSLFTIVLDVLASAPASAYPLNLNARLRDEQGAIRESTIQNGTITVVAQIHMSDFSGDGQINFQDFILFAQHMGGIKGDTRYNARFDLNANDRIDFSDFIQFAQAFGKL
ncbi:MAG: cohesin domain-containing protein [Candidatus Latescibacteria bacterium]|nr:cohesin domain-containing protein [Candidatus Latescibacterota bacterium]